MPIPSNEDIGGFTDYNERDFLAKRGCSTVDLVSGRYTVMESLTTYHPTGELVPQWRYVRCFDQLYPKVRLHLH